MLNKAALDLFLLTDAAIAAGETVAQFCYWR